MVLLEKGTASAVPARGGRGSPEARPDRWRAAHHGGSRPAPVRCMAAVVDQRGVRCQAERDHQEFRPGTGRFRGPGGFRAAGGTPSAPADYGPPKVAEAPGHGGTIGIMYIPRFGADYTRPIVQGTSTDVLDTLGLGHYSDTAMPGATGNFAVAGHRQTHGAVLDNIHTLVPGDRIYVQTKDGFYVYVFRNNQIVLPSATDVLLPVPTQPAARPTESLPHHDQLQPALRLAGTHHCVLPPGPLAAGVRRAAGGNSGPGGQGAREGLTLCTDGYSATCRARCGSGSSHRWCCWPACWY